MDLTQQIKNAMATMELSRPKKPFVSEDKDVRAHMQVRFGAVKRTIKLDYC